MDHNTMLKEIKKLRVEKQASINNTYMWVNYCINSIAQLENTPLSFPVPKTKRPSKDRIIKINTRRTRKIIEQIRTKEIYNASFVYIISIVEDFLSQVIRLMLQTDNEKIKVTIPGINFRTDYSIIDIVDSDSKEQILEDIINSRVVSIMYKQPKKQSEYFAKALGIKLDQEYWDAWFEMKATRDLIIHNSNEINGTYINKTGELARGTVGESITIDDAYFRNSISYMKSIIGKIEYIIKKEL